MTCFDEEPEHQPTKEQWEACEANRKPYRDTKTILIHFEHPPIPDRRFDYVALYEGEEQRQVYGHGPTPQAALRDLIETHDGPPQIEEQALRAAFAAYARVAVIEWSLFGMH